MWNATLQSLFEIAELQPHVAYCAFTHGVSSQWLNLCRTTPNICHLLSELEVTIRQQLLPRTSGRPPPGDFETVLFSIPVKGGGLNFTIPVALDCEFDRSRAITRPLISLMLSNSNYSHDTVTDQIIAKAMVKSDKTKIINEKLSSLQSSLPKDLQYSFFLLKRRELQIG